MPPSVRDLIYAWMYLTHTHCQDITSLPDQPTAAAFASSLYDGLVKDGNVTANQQLNDIMQKWAKSMKLPANAGTYDTVHQALIKADATAWPGAGNHPFYTSEFGATFK